MQLCTNTQQYNEDGSLIFEVRFLLKSCIFQNLSLDQFFLLQDSIVLQSVFTNARERLEQVVDSEEEEEGLYSKPY